MRFGQIKRREIFESLIVKPASFEELVAVPNVTAIDWKQADVFGPSFEHKGGMSHGLRLMPPFLLFQLLIYPPHVGAVETISKD